MKFDLFQKNNLGINENLISTPYQTQVMEGKRELIGSIVV